MALNEKGYTVQCCKCLCILGISVMNFQREEIYCMKCAKKVIDSQILNKGCGKMFFNEKISRTSDCNKHHLCPNCSLNLKTTEDKK